MERLLLRMIRSPIHIFVVSWFKVVMFYLFSPFPVTDPFIVESASPVIGIITVMGISWIVTKYQALH